MRIFFKSYFRDVPTIWDPGTGCGSGSLNQERIGKQFTFIFPCRGYAGFVDSLWNCDLVLERLKKIYGWEICFEYDYLQSRLVIVYFQTGVLFLPLVWRTNDGKSKRITTVPCARAILLRSFLVWVVALLFTFKRRLNFHHYCMYHTYMYAFTSEKQVSEGLLRGDHSSSSSLSKREFRLHENERVSPNARNGDF